MTVELTQVGDGLHAVVIGVNRYRHLSGGDPAELRDQYKKLGQLISPVPSARRVASWLLNERVDATSPLRSIQILLSDAATQPPLISSKNDNIVVSDPTMDNIVRAVEQLKDSADEYASNKILFYFCGHGLSYNVEDVLLPEDFGRSKNNVFRTAVNVKHLLTGMKTCRAESQLFLFDACRSSGMKLKPLPLSFGDPIINFDGTGEVNAKQVSLWSSTTGNAAYGYLNGEPSVFSQALLAAFRGAAARKENSVYHISSLRLKEAIDAYIRRRAEVQQVTEIVSATPDFQIAQMLASPVVPITVLADTNAGMPANMSCWEHIRPGTLHRRYDGTPIVFPWHVDVEAGTYDFSACAHNGDIYTKNEAHVEPPYVDIHCEKACES